MVRPNYNKTKIMMNYSEYTAQIMSDPSYYGSECSTADAAAICERLAALITDAFPGIEVRTWNDTIGGSAATLGPDQSVCDEINLWISSNWTAAL